MKSQVMEAARAKHRPEFINRIHEVVVFQPLNPQQICEIVKLQVLIHSPPKTTCRVCCQIAPYICLHTRPKPSPDQPYNGYEILKHVKFCPSCAAGGCEQATTRAPKNPGQ
ncbi:hypothetical protein KC19_VG217100 [Ceratodon purpureus]|uniref:Uncharacterized protein n=1 Tax=Ceratodon purpureus TaxID=3225 RepID=A0A8T0HSD4_CERPU|nr:hypothetical protein KC19_VG217100 [Ceratodon purpureus]